MRKSNYDKLPCVSVPGAEQACVQGWEAIAEKLQQAIGQRIARKTVLAIECYTGIDADEIRCELLARLRPTLAGMTRYSDFYRD